MWISSMRVILLMTICIAAIAAVPRRTSQRIVGGAITNINQYPHAAALLYSSWGTSYSQSCGGTIINTRSILSAAHCFYYDSPSNWRARVGSTWANSGGKVYTTSNLILHSKYNSYTSDNDVAILQVSGTFTYGSTVMAASIAGSNYNLGDNQAVWAVGWGTTSFGGSLSEELRHVQIWTVNQAVCRSRYAGINSNVTDNMLCSGWIDVGGRDQCQGDSGGPLIHNKVVVGICSWGAGCAQAYYPGVNTRVSRFTSWIVSNA